MTRVRIALIVVLASTGMFGCAKERVHELTEQAKTYNRSLRWGSIPAAGTLVAEDVRRSVIDRLSRELDDIKIVDFTIIDLGLDEKKKKGSVVVNFSYYNINHEVLKNRQEVQFWEYDGAIKKWLLRDYKPITPTR